MIDSIYLWSLWGLGSIVLSLGSIAYCWSTTTSRFPASIPWAGARNEVFSRPRAWIRELSAGLTTVHEGYFTHNKKGNPFIVFDTAGRPNVILPKESARWLVGQPDNVLNARKVLDTRFALDYFVLPPRKEIEEGLLLAIRRDLTRNLGRTQTGSFGAIRERVDALMGMQESWHEVSLVGVLGPVISGVSHRMLVGDELYHNEKFMKALANFGNLFGLASLLIGQYAPFFVRPLLGYPASVLVRLYRRKALKFLVPVAQNRIDVIQRKIIHPTYSDEPRLDVMQWCTMNCPDATADEISACILSLTLAATHSTIVAFTGTFLDLLSSPAEIGFYEAIAEEAASVFKTEEDFGNIASLQKLSRIDSTIRESMRRNPLTSRGFMQEVVHKSGITLPGGHKIPHGAWLAVSLTGIGQDERYYSDPHNYDPFRFSRARAEIALMDKNKKVSSRRTDGIDDSTETASEKLTGTDCNKLNGSWLTTITEEFGSFGFGRHSCAGRWFASHIMKMTLAYIALKYEIQHIKDRPANMVIGDVLVPPQNVNIKVRRRR